MGKIVSLPKEALDPLHIIYECRDCAEEFRASLELSVQGQLIVRDICPRCRGRKKSKSVKERLRTKLIWSTVTEKEAAEKLVEAAKLN